MNCFQNQWWGGTASQSNDATLLPTSSHLIDNFQAVFSVAVPPPHHIHCFQKQWWQQCFCCHLLTFDFFFFCLFFQLPGTTLGSNHDNNALLPPPCIWLFSLNLSFLHLQEPLPEATMITMLCHPPPHIWLFYFSLCWQVLFSPEQQHSFLPTAPGPHQIDYFIFSGMRHPLITFIVLFSLHSGTTINNKCCTTHLLTFDCSIFSCVGRLFSLELQHSFLLESNDHAAPHPHHIF